MNIRVVEKKILKTEIVQLAKETYDDMIKGVCDVNKCIIALGGELHADAETVLLDKGSKQEGLWGFNLYPNRIGDERYEYTSFINIRPSHGNSAIKIKDQGLRDTIKNIVDQRVDWSS